MSDPTLQTALQRHTMALPDAQAETLERYCRLLWEWNERLNLTRHTDFDKFVSRDLVDSLQLAALLEPGEEILDVGSGGGVPGLVLAVIRPDLQVSVSESVTKRARVLEEFVRELDLPVPVFDQRAERVLDDMSFDTLTARAVGPMWKILTWFRENRAAVGRLLLVKGPRWPEARKEARARGLLQPWELRKRVSYPMAGTDSESVILEITPRRQ